MRFWASGPLPKLDSKLPSYGPTPICFIKNKKPDPIIWEDQGKLNLESSKGKLDKFPCPWTYPLSTSIFSFCIGKGREPPWGAHPKHGTTNY